MGVFGTVMRTEGRTPMAELELREKRDARRDHQGMFGTPCGAAKDKDGMDTRPRGNVMVSLDIISAEDRSRVKKSCGPPCNPAMSKLPAPNWLCMLQSDPKISSRELQWWDHIVQETMRTTTPGWPAVGRDKFEFASSRTSAGSETLRAAGQLLCFLAHFRITTRAVTLGNRSFLQDLSNSALRRYSPTQSFLVNRPTIVKGAVHLSSEELQVLFHSSSSWACIQTHLRS